MSDWNDDQMERLSMEREEDGMLQRAENERADQHPGALRERRSINGGTYCCPLCEAGRTFTAAREMGDWDLADRAYNWLFELKAESETDAYAQVDELRAELEAVKNERDLAVLTLAAHTPADKPLPTGPHDAMTESFDQPEGAA